MGGGRWVKVVAGADQRDRPADGGQPQRDRVVKQHAGQDVGGGEVVEDQRADQACVDDADPAGDGQNVGQVAEEVGQHEHRGGGVNAERGQATPQHGYVGAGVGERAGQPPVGVGEQPHGVGDCVRGGPGGGADLPMAGKVSGAARCHEKHGQDEQPGSGGQYGQKRVAWAREQADGEREAGEDQG